jgi:hypothetical protein
VKLLLPCRYRQRCMQLLEPAGEGATRCFKYTAAAALQHARWFVGNGRHLSLWPLHELQIYDGLPTCFAKENSSIVVQTQQRRKN